MSSDPSVSQRRVHFGPKKVRTYRGLIERADFGLHQQIADVVNSSVVKGSRVLDMGAGQGALARRLADDGHEVVAVDIDESDFLATEVPFIKVNFDDPGELGAFVTGNAAAFDVVLGVEVIEHVEDQWRYVRQLFELVRPGGLVLITTPNVTSWLSRVIFFLSGRFHQFSDADVEYGHVSPITPWELGLILDRCGGQDIVLRSAGTLPAVYLSGLNKESLLSLLMLPFRGFVRGLKDGWCVLATARRSGGP